MSGFDSFGGGGGSGSGGGGKSESSSASSTSGNQFGSYGGDGGGLSPLTGIIIAAVVLFGFLVFVLIAKK